MPYQMGRKKFFVNIFSRRHDVLAIPHYLSIYGSVGPKESPNLPQSFKAPPVAHLHAVSFISTVVKIDIVLIFPGSMVGA